MTNVILCGVGGQGTVLASRIIAAAAMEKGEFVQTAETIGMAQRGGCVVSHVRIGTDAETSLVPMGSADVIIAFEPSEAVRNLPYLKKDGVLITSDRAIQPVTVSLSGTSYDADEMLEFLKNNVDRCYVIDTHKIIEECGSIKPLNVALVGALAKSGVIDLTTEDVENILKEKVKEAFLEMNKKALRIGGEAL
ncbi:MAG: indolepyruvate oxidoreductase subunit beta [bacterium]|nr:indolepyruvate oxidoreductase subunit beta [bacterium]